MSTDKALLAAERILTLLQGDITSQLEQIRRCVEQLSHPATWDGPGAARFRSTVSPSVLASVSRTIRRLSSLGEFARSVNQQITTSGTVGMLVGGSVVTAAAAPDARVRAALTYFHGHIDSVDVISGDRADLEGIGRQLQGMTPQEINEFIGGLSPRDLQKWNQRMLDTGDLLWYQDGLAGADRIALIHTLLKSADQTQLARLQQYMPGLEPDPGAGGVDIAGHRMGGVGITGWESGANLPLYGGSGGPDPTADINQGQDGDCWFMAGLGAVAETNPALIANHIRQNPNGTYTVTFYQDGHPVPVTVTDQYPSGPNGWNGYAYSHTSSDYAKWAMVYEKAYAELKGGYGSIDNGDASTALTDLTGRSASESSVGDRSLSDIGARLGDGYAVTSSTPTQWPWDGEIENSPAGDIVRQHQYYVQSVDTSVHPPTITLVNPWGSGIDGSPAAPQRVTLTEQQWHQYFSDVQYAKVT